VGTRSEGFVLVDNPIEGPHAVSRTTATRCCWRLFGFNVGRLGGFDLGPAPNGLKAAVDCSAKGEDDDPLSRLFRLD
jgi:hypothetical protein